MGRCYIASDIGVSSTGSNNDITKQIADGVRSDGATQQKRKRRGEWHFDVTDARAILHGLLVNRVNTRERP